MNPESAHVTAEDIRVSIRMTLDAPCECGDCPTDEILRQMLAMSDADLMAAYAEIGA